MKKEKRQRDTKRNLRYDIWDELCEEEGLIKINDKRPLDEENLYYEQNNDNNNDNDNDNNEDESSDFNIK